MQKNQSIRTARSGKAESAARPRFLRVLITISVVLILFLPTYIAVAHYQYKKAHPTVEPETSYVATEITGPQEHHFSSGTAGNEKLLDLFREFLTNATTTLAIPEGFDGVYAVRMKTNAGDNDYTFRFSVENADCYFTDGAAIYHADRETTAAFLNSSFACELYPQAATPVLTTAATDIITPSEMEWNYRTQDHTFTARTDTETTNELRVYPIANDVGFTFSPKPSTCTVKIRRGENETTYNSSDHISLSQLDDGEVLDIVITAIYNEGSQSDYYGSATYRFRMNVVEAARFNVNADTIRAGEYFMFACENVRNMQNLQITAEPALKAESVVFRLGDTVYAAIPTEDIGTKTVTVGYGTISSSFELTVTAWSGNALLKTAAELRGDWQTAAGGYFRSLVAAKHGAPTDCPAPRGTFAAVSEPFARVAAFGDTLTATDAGVETPFPLPFEVYVGSGNVKAQMFGTVREVGEDVTFGKYVIVDHGCGLLSWYLGLDEIRVSAGAPLAGGDIIGIAGTGGIGLAETEGFLFAATVGGTPIAPDCLRARAFPGV